MTTQEKLAPVLTAHDLSVDFSQGDRLLRVPEDVVHAVREVNLELSPGECLGLVGESGSGKSTLARCLVGLVSPTSGNVLIRGVDVHRASRVDRKLIKRTAQMVFQDPQASLNPRMRAGDLIREAINLRHELSKSDVNRKVSELLEQVGLPDHYRSRYLSELSGGEGQRIAIARALGVKPSLLICDEPTSALDVSVQQNILNLLIRLRDEVGLSYLFISHDLGLVSRIADRMAVMKDGRILESGRTGEIIRTPATAYAKDLIKAAQFPEINALQSADVAIDSDEPSKKPSPGKPVALLNVANMTVRFAGNDAPAVDGVSLVAWPGDRVGVIGESGSGKTTLGRAVMRLLDERRASISEQTRVLFNGRELMDLTQGEIRTLRGSAIAPVFQNPSSALNPSLRIGVQLIDLARLHHRVDKGTATTLSLDALRRADLPDPKRVMRSFPHELSGGMSQRAFIAMAMICRPQLIIADEPTSALDVTVQASILTMLERLNREFGVTFILVTHDIGVAARFCNRIYVMRSGRILESGSTQSVLGHPQAEYTKTLISANPSLGVLT